MFEAIAKPFGWILMTLYDWVGNYGLALILVAIVIKVILLPFQMKGKRGQLRQSRLQPKISELQKRHAANKQKLNEEMAKLYKEEGVNPASGCLWSFIQMPIMIAMFFAIREPLTIMMGVSRDLLNEGGAIFEKLTEMRFFEGVAENAPYLQVEQAQFITKNFEVFAPFSENLHRISFDLGPLNLAEVPNWQIWAFPWDNFSLLFPMLLLMLFPLLSGGAQFVSAHIMRKMNVAGSPEAAGGTMGTVLKFMPLMSVFFGFMFPAALSLYWTVGTILQIGQDIWLTKKYTKILDAEDAEKAVLRKAKEADIEAKRLETERLKAEGLAERNRNTSKRKKQKSDKQDKQEKAAEWEKKNAPEPEEEVNEPSRVGNRRFARGRAYDPDRYSKESDSTDDSDNEVIEVDEEDVEIIDTDTFSDDEIIENDDYEEDDYEVFDEDDFEEDDEYDEDEEDENDNP